MYKASTASIEVRLRERSGRFCVAGGGGGGVKQIKPRQIKILGKLKKFYQFK
jgi:hypothetical protein